MANRQHDDIDALYSRAGLDSTKYRDFSSSRRVKEVVPPEPPCEPAASVDAADTEFDVAKAVQAMGATTDMLVDDDQIAPPTLFVQSEQRASGASTRLYRRRGMRTGSSYPTSLYPSGMPLDKTEPTRPQIKTSSSALNKSPEPSRVAQSPARAERWPIVREAASQFAPPVPAAASAQLPEGSFSLFSLGGGTGKSTVCATVVRCLRETGERLLVADLAEDGILPFYFGSQHLRSGSLETFLSEDQQNFEPLHVYSEGEVGSTRVDGHNSVVRLQAQISALGDNLDRVILDLPAGAHKARWPLLQAARSCLVIIVPDLHSLIRVGKLEQVRQQLHTDHGNNVTFFYLLNKFNPTRPLHLEIRQRLHEQLGERLLPIYIQRSDEIPEALAAGSTVVDYSPQAPVVQDFLRLTDWIRGIA